jgi:hypothetical protein
MFTESPSIFALFSTTAQFVPVAPVKIPGGPFWGRDGQKGPVPATRVLSVFDAVDGSSTGTRVPRLWE